MNRVLLISSHQDYATYLYNSLLKISKESFKAINLVDTHKSQNEYSNETSNTSQELVSPLNLANIDLDSLKPNPTSKNASNDIHFQEKIHLKTKYYTAELEFKQASSGTACLELSSMMDDYNAIIFIADNKISSHESFKKIAEKSDGCDLVLICVQSGCILHESDHTSQATLLEVPFEQTCMDFCWQYIDSASLLEDSEYASMSNTTKNVPDLSAAAVQEIYESLVNNVWPYSNLNVVPEKKIDHIELVKDEHDDLDTTQKQTNKVCDDKEDQWSEFKGFDSSLNDDDFDSSPVDDLENLDFDEKELGLLLSELKSMKGI
ncbi:hypothetical protein AYI70_g8792 [Smittium culicis]|uniref:Uncharacterized protein n=1 Tax=Smittium culicis TaxID=133412 RepID=A0A1R1XEE3_9FUNG|nr:hypothetical protein AYI70_g8792 [Smittium culicis]